MPDEELAQAVRDYRRRLAGFRHFQWRDEQIAKGPPEAELTWGNCLYETGGVPSSTSNSWWFFGWKR